MKQSEVKNWDFFDRNIPPIDDVDEELNKKTEEAQDKVVQNKGSQYIDVKDIDVKDIDVQDIDAQNKNLQNNGSQNNGSQNSGSQNSGSQNNGSQYKDSQNNGTHNNESTYNTQDHCGPQYRQVDNPIFNTINEIKKVLTQTGFNHLNDEVVKIENSLSHNKFKISVVGEFSRGKSTFINNLFERDILPVGNLPTTAIMTKITYHPTEMMVHVGAKGNKRQLPLKEESWEGLTADIHHMDPQGVVFIGLNSKWLERTGIEIIDTPGAGDLNEQRALLINDALLCGDGAIVTISAEHALSMTERDFIEQRLIAAKLPHMLMIITHLDNVKAENRTKVVTYIQERLALWKFDLPIFIPQKELEIPGMDCSSYMGMDKIKAELEQWVNSSDNQFRRNDNACVQLQAIIEIAQASVKEKYVLLSADKQKKEELLEQQINKISKVQLYWEDLRLEMLKRGNSCYEWLRSSVQEKSENLIERLQYEASHANVPQKWWEEDYPYRLKIELMNLAATLEGGLSQHYANDVRWLNDILYKQFKSSVSSDKEVIADKVLFKEMKSSAQLEFEDVAKQRNIARLGTGALTIAGYALFAGLGPLAIITSVSVGTGSAVITEKLFKGKIEKQQQEIKEVIGKDIPRVIDNAMSISEQRLSEAYAKAVKEAQAQEELWAKTQYENIQMAGDPEITNKSNELESLNKQLNGLSSKLNTYMEG